MNKLDLGCSFAELVAAINKVLEGGTIDSSKYQTIANMVNTLSDVDMLKADEQYVSAYGINSLASSVNRNIGVGSDSGYWKEVFILVDGKTTPDKFWAIEWPVTIGTINGKCLSIQNVYNEAGESVLFYATKKVMFDINGDWTTITPSTTHIYVVLGSKINCSMTVVYEPNYKT